MDMESYKLMNHVAHSSRQMNTRGVNKFNELRLMCTLYCATCSLVARHWYRIVKCQPGSPGCISAAESQFWQQRHPTENTSFQKLIYLFIFATILLNS